MLSDITKMWTKLIVLACLMAVSQARFINTKHPLTSGRLIGGVDAQPGEFPHQVSIQVFLSVDPIHLCGGSIIDEQWILTSANCIQATEGLYSVIKTGKHALNVEESTEQDSYIKKYFVNENYTGYAGISPYDVALVKLASPLRFDKYVAPISLAAKDSEPSGKVIMSGWGAKTIGGEESVVFNVLQKGSRDIVDRATCRKELEAAATAEGFEVEEDFIDETNICTGSSAGGMSVCNNDLGGPLISKDENGKTELVGVASWLRPCGRRGYPSVYVKVASIVDWIHDIISKN